MKIFKTIAEAKSALEAERLSGKTIALVPTMGYLHEGHMVLVREGAKKADLTVVYIFVNPLQFNDPNDLASYPIDLKGDLVKLEKTHAWGVFLPTREEIYPPGFQSWVTPGDLAQKFEGAFRPGHFRGVATVVTRFFEIIRPNLAVFGEKDFQQLQVIKQVVKDLRLGIEIVPVATVREPDGLAMSSRNVRLKDSDRKQATALYKALSSMREKHMRGEKSAATLIAEAKAYLQQHAVTLEYLAIVDSETLRELEVVSENARALIAAAVSGVRLIDNVALN